jgi:hypothetical protein
MGRLSVLVVALVLAGCGGGAPSEVVPADVTLYVGASADEADMLLTLTSRADLAFDRDVKPWLGERAAYFQRGGEDEYGLVFASENDERAEAFARKVASGGPLRASAVIDGYLVLASSRELLRAANASAGGQSLADSARLDIDGEDEEDAPDILMAGDHPDVLLSRLPWPEQGSIPTDAFGDDPVTARLWNASGVQRIEVTGLPARADAAPTLADVPGAAWLAFASADLGEDAALAGAHEQYVQIERATGLDLERAVLPHLGAGMFFVQGRNPYDMGGRLVAETGNEDALRREAIAFARQLGPRRADLVLEPPGADERFLELVVDLPDLPHVFVRIRDGRLSLDVGAAPGGVADDLDDTRAYRDAERRLGGRPTFVMTDDRGYIAARDAVEDGRRVVRGVTSYR